MFKSKTPRILAAIAACIACSGAANASSIQITEWMYKGNNGEFVEFTNLGATAIDMTGWSYSDSGRVAGHVGLSAFGVVQPGESVILTETLASTFRTAWGLSSAVKIVGSNSTDNLGNGDEINIYDASSNLVDRLTYGTTPATQNKSASIPFTDLDLTTANTSWALAAIGDSYGSYASTGGDIGNPGKYVAPVPVPAAVLLLLSGMGLFGPAVRRQAAGKYL